MLAIKILAALGLAAVATCIVALLADDAPWSWEWQEWADWLNDKPEDGREE